MLRIRYQVLLEFQFLIFLLQVFGHCSNTVSNLYTIQIICWYHSHRFHQLLNITKLFLHLTNTHYIYLLLVQRESLFQIFLNFEFVIFIFFFEEDVYRLYLFCQKDCHTNYTSIHRCTSFSLLNRDILIYMKNYQYKLIFSSTCQIFHNCTHWFCFFLYWLSYGLLFKSREGTIVLNS